MSIRSIIIDDEQHNIDNVRSMLERCCPEAQVVATAMNAMSAIHQINTHRPNLIFLDIQMPGGSGFDVLKALEHDDFEVIFITAYDQYGIQAIKFSALDYLLKPIDEKEFEQAIVKAKNRIAYRHSGPAVAHLLEYISKERTGPPKLALPMQEETRYVSLNNIVCCQASNNYTTFFLQEDDQLLVCKTLKEFERLLQEHGFIRCHQSWLVNSRFVKSWLKEDGGVLLLSTGAKIPISRLNREKVRDALGAAGK